MGLWNTLTRWVTGQDIAAEQTRAQQLDQSLIQYNEQSGYYDRIPPDMAAAAQQRITDQQTEDTDLQGQVEDAFAAGAQQGLQNEVEFVTRTVPRAISDTLNAVGGAVWRSIPWWVWLLAGVALFLYAGGGVWLRGRLARSS